ncbi:MAG: GNAT family N-acetyltransferase [bacterium]
MMEVRFLHRDEVEQCLTFFNAMHGVRRTVEQWRWEFESRAFTPDEVPHAVVKDQGKVVGSQALIPIRLIDERGVFWTAKSEATVLDPEYRGQGLFDRMYELMFEYADRHQLAFIWGFTQAVKPLRKVGFQIPAHTTQLLFPFSRSAITRLLPRRASGQLSDAARRQFLAVGSSMAAALATVRLNLTVRRLRRLKGARSISIRTLEHAPPDAGDLCARFIECWGGTTIYRDADYLEWRLFRNPFLKSIFRAAYDGDRLVGWVAFAIGDDGIAYLVDILAVDSSGGRYKVAELVEKLLIEAVLGARNMGAVAIRGWHVNAHPFDQVILRVARRVGFLHVRKGYAMVVYAGPSAAERGGSSDDWYVNRVYTEGILG